ncbi:MAG: acyl-coenzyme A thioesterase PaaI-like protein, partial [Glaciecola sp.]
AGPPRRRDYRDIKRRMYEVELGEGDPVSHFDECFVSGTQNPMGIAMRVRREGDEMVAEVTLGAAFEGAPGRAHGGIVAAMFDDILGYLTTMLQTPAFTGSLTVNYLAPTPIGVPLTLRARVINRDGRRIFCEAEATVAADEAGEAAQVVATSSATFITVPLKAFKP